MMRRPAVPGTLWLPLVLCLGLWSVVAAAPRRVALTFSLGATDEESTPWNGELRCPRGVVVEEAGVLALYPPRKQAGLTVAGPDRIAWQGSSKREAMRDYFKKRPVVDPAGEPIHFPLKPYSFTVQFAATTWGEVTVALDGHEPFGLNPDAMAFGQARTFLDGKVRVERSLPSSQLGTCQAESGAILYNDFPAIGAGTDGAVWATYVAYEGRQQPRVSLAKDPENFAPLEQPVCNDQLMAVREEGGVPGEPEPITTAGLDLFQPALAVQADGSPLVVWCQRTEQNWDLYASARGGDGWSPPARLTNAPGPDLYPVLLATGTDCWLAWQGFRDGTSRIFLARLDGRTLALGTAVAVTDGTANCWMPALAADSRGTVAVAYDTYAKGDYDVHCALYSHDGAAPKHVPVATSLRYEAHASVAFDARDRLWVAWEEAGENWGKDFGGKAAPMNLPGEGIDNGRTLRVACLDNGRLRPLQASLDDVLPLQQTILTVYGKPRRTRESIFTDQQRYAYYPRLAGDRAGHVYLAFRQHDYLPDVEMARQTIWSDFVTVLAGDRWLPPARLLGSDGHRHCAPALCVLPTGGVAVAGAGDSRASRPRRLCESGQAVRLGRYAPGGPATSPALLAPVDAPVPETPTAVTAEREAVRRLRGFRTTASGTTYRILRGDFHRHTAFSSDSACGDGSIDDAFRYALDAAALDTMGNGDHDNGGGFEYPWYMTQKFYDLYLQENHFVPMFSYERSVTAVGPQGHRNIIMPRRGVRVLPVHGRDNIDANGSIEDTRLLFQFLRRNGFVSIPHTIGTGAGANFVDRAPDVDCVVEIYQGARNAYEYPRCPRGIAKGNDPGFYWQLLRSGGKYGVIASSDHRSTHISYAMLYVAETNREGVMEALRRRHCYAATDNILLHVGVGGTHIMGDELALDGAPELQIHVVGTGPVKAIDIIRNAEIYHTVSPDAAVVDLAWRDPAPVSGESSYYVRVTQQDGELAWGTPLWIRRP